MRNRMTEDSPVTFWHPDGIYKYRQCYRLDGQFVLYRTFASRLYTISAYYGEDNDWHVMDEYTNYWQGSVKPLTLDESYAIILSDAEKLGISAVY